MSTAPSTPAQKRKRVSKQTDMPNTSCRASAHWSTEEDQTLKNARARGGHWQEIAKGFPGKSSNACRKRHERLMEKRKIDDWEQSAEFQRIAKAYLEVRQEMWSILAKKLGEKWSTVEEKCMEKGLHNIKTAARAQTREDARRAPQGMDDDSGIGLSDTEPSPDLRASNYPPAYTDSRQRLPPLSTFGPFSSGPTIASMLAPSSAH